MILGQGLLQENMEGKVSEKLALEKHDPWSGVVTGKHGGKGLRTEVLKKQWSLVRVVFIWGSTVLYSITRLIVFPYFGTWGQLVRLEA